MKGESMEERSIDESTMDEFRHRWVSEVRIPGRSAGTEMPGSEPDRLSGQEMAWAFELIEGLTYREGSRIWISETQRQYGALVIACTMSTVDVDHVYDRAEIRCSRAVELHRLRVEPGKDQFQAALMREVWTMLRDLEDHERMEWLRVGGQAVYDPHPGGKLTSTSVPDLLHPRLGRLGQPVPKAVPVGISTTMDHLLDRFAGGELDEPYTDRWLEKLKDYAFPAYAPPALTDHSRDRIEAEWAAEKAQRDEVMGPQSSERPWYQAPGSEYIPYLAPLPLPEPIPWGKGGPSWWAQAAFPVLPDVAEADAVKAILKGITLP